MATTEAVRGQSLSYTLSATDVSSVDQAAGFTYSVNWNDGSAVQTVGPGAASPSTVTHTFATNGTYTISVTATDKDGGTSTATLAVTISSTAMEGNNLFVGGTTGNDHIIIVPSPIKPASGHGKPTMGVEVLINGVSQGSFSPSGSIIVFAQAGNDNVQVPGGVKNNAFLFGGDGNDRLKGGGGNNVKDRATNVGAHAG